MKTLPHQETVTICLPDAAFRVTLTPRGMARLEFLPSGAGGDPPGAAGEREGTDRGAPEAAQLAEYLRGERRQFTISPDLTACSPFQREVLEACAAVPWGEVVTYAELARRLDRPGAARAVGHALARNPVPLLIPCHRVLRGDGGLGGFIAGLEWKRRLLRLEGVLHS